MKSIAKKPNARRMVKALKECFTHVLKTILQALFHNPWLSIGFVENVDKLKGWRKYE
jgi:hypothetical protein